MFDMFSQNRIMVKMNPTDVSGSFADLQINLSQN